MDARDVFPGRSMRITSSCAVNNHTRNNSNDRNILLKMILLPSKKVLSILILVAAMTTSIIITFGKDKSATAINFASNLVAGEKLSIPANPNWQNDLEKVSLPEESALPESEESTSPETTTDLVSKSILSNYLTLKQNGVSNQESTQKLVDQTLTFIDQSGNSVTLISQLNIVPDNGKQSMMDYGENLGRVLKNIKPAVIKDELAILTQIAQSRDLSKIEELESIIAYYKKLEEELTKMPVPKTFAKSHLDMTNGARAMATALTQTKSLLSDPIKVLASIQLHQQGAGTLIESFEATVGFIRQNNIVYKQGTGGYYLLYGI